MKKRILVNVGFLLTVFAVSTYFDATVAVTTNYQNIIPPILSQNTNSSVSSQNTEYQNIVNQVNPINNENKFSLIEKSFTGEGLKQIGYDMFQNFSTQGGGKYGSSYILHIGEKLKIYQWGDSVDMFSLTGGSLATPLTDTVVDSSGNIFVPGAGVIKAEGKSLLEVGTGIQNLLRQKMTNVKVKVSIADSNEFSVFVYGYVNKPGRVSVGSTSSILEALAAAGGVSKNGSLRNITYKSANASSKIDLYDIVLKGKNINISFKPNDKIFVNSIGEVAAIKNGVKLPGIYELKPNETINTIISYAGGLLPTTNNIVVNIKSFDSKLGQRISKDVSKDMYNKTNLTNGDIVEFKDLYSKAENFIELKGNIKHPGIFQYKKGMTLSDLLPSKNELMAETFIYQAVIKRTTGTEKQVKSIPVALNDFFNGGIDPKLEPNDIITVYKATNISSIEVYGCINNPKTIPYNENMTLKDILANLIFVRSGNIQNVNKKTNTVVNSQNAAVLKSPIKGKNKTVVKSNEPQNISTQYDNIVYSPSDIAVEVSNTKANTTKIFYLYDILVKNDTTSAIAINENDKILFRPLRDNEIVKSVKVSGYVNQPGVYRFIKGQKLSDTLAMASGLSEDSNLKGIVLKRPSILQEQRKNIFKNNERDKKSIESTLTSDNILKNDTEAQKLLIESIQKDKSSEEFNGRIVLDLKDNDLSKISSFDNIEIQDGDEIYVPRISNHVTIIGELYNQSSFAYVPGKNANYYINNAGGYTANAKKSSIYKIAANGKAYKLKHLANAKVEPGDTIVVPRKIANNWLQVLQTSLQLGFNALNAIFLITRL